MLDSKLASWARRSPLARPVGIAAYRAIDRVRPALPGPRLVVNSIPKSGTHLASALFDAVPGFRFNGRLLWVDGREALADDGVAATARVQKDLRRTKPRHYMMAHAMYHPRLAAGIADVGVPVVTMVRDPRAIAASAVRYFEENRVLRRQFESRLFERREDMAQYVLDGGRYGKDENGKIPLHVRCREFHGWAEDPNCLLIRFEDLIGTRGGGSDEHQLAMVKEILRFTGTDAITSAEELAEKMYSDSSQTFSVGKVRSWESVLTPDQVAQVEEQCADTFAAFGYEL